VSSIQPLGWGEDGFGGGGGDAGITTETLVPSEYSDTFSTTRGWDTHRSGRTILSPFLKRIILDAWSKVRTLEKAQSFETQPSGVDK
jgi:hypothetical protein